MALKLRPFTANLRGFARDSVPTIKSLDGIVKRPGAANDLIELTRLQVPLAEIGVGPVDRNGATRQGALPASARALTDSLPQLSFLRPYLTAEGVTGWFDDFGHSGFPDAIGGIGRIGTTLQPLLRRPAAASPGNLIEILTALPDAGDLPNAGAALEALGFSAPEPEALPRLERARTPADQLTYGGSLDCDPTEVPIGP